jgi:hypothetical protein
MLPDPSNAPDQKRAGPSRFNSDPCSRLLYLVVSQAKPTRNHVNVKKANHTGQAFETQHKVAW